MGEFNSDDHYTVGRNPLEEMEQLHGQQKSPNAVLRCNLKNDRMTSVHFQGKPFNITVIQVHALTSNAEEAEVEWFYEDLQDLLEVTPQKVSFSFQGTGMQKQEVKKHLEYQANLALECRMKQGKD